MQVEVRAVVFLIMQPSVSPPWLRMAIQQEDNTAFRNEDRSLCER